MPPPPLRPPIILATNCLFVLSSLLLLLLSPCSSGLRCYACNGHAAMKCLYFNASHPDPAFVVECGRGQLACRKGWVNSALPGEEPEIRSCTAVPEDICMKQNGGGSCSCITDLCNSASRTSSINVLLAAVSLRMFL